jgi:large repetitive protein
MTKLRALLVLLFVCAFAPLAVAQEADLLVTKSGPAITAPGANVTYTVTLQNIGGSPATVVSLVDTIPAGMTFVSAASSDGTFGCSTPVVGNGGQITCSGTTLLIGGSVTFTFVVQTPFGASYGAQFTNSATASTQTPETTNTNNTATATTTVSFTDLSVTKSGPAQAAAGSNVTYTVTLINGGPGTALNVSLEDVIPGGMTFVSASNDGGFSCDTPAAGDPGTITCTSASMAAGTTVTFTFVVQIDAQPEGSEFVNFATVTSQTYDVNQENNTGIVVTTLPPPPQADMSVTKSGPSTAGPDTDVTFTIVVTNNGPSAATNVTVQDTLPGPLTLVSLSNTNDAALPCTSPAVGAGGTITCNAATLAAGATATLTLVVHVPPYGGDHQSGSTYSNVATVTSDDDPNEENDVSTTGVTVSSVDISIDKSGPAVIVAGSNISYTLVVTNTAGEAALDVVLYDPLPPGTTFVSLVHNSGPVAICTTGDGNVTCTYGVLAPGSPSQYTLTLAVGNATSITNAATVTTSSFDTNSGNDTDSVVTTVTQSADVAVTKTASPAAVAGTNVTFNVTVTNNGPSNATNVSLADVLPANTTFVSLAQNSGPSFTCGHAAGTITCTIATLNVGATAAFTFVANVGAGATGSLLNTAAVSTTTADPGSLNNTASATTTLSTSADVAVTKTAPAAVVSGSNVTFTIAATNAGPSSALNVSLTDVVPATLTFVSMTQITGPVFTCGQAAGTVTCTIASLAPSDAATFELIATTTVEGPVTNTVNVTSSTADAQGSNNSASATTTVARAVADVAIVKSANLTAAFPGGAATYTVVVTNNGPGPAANVVVTDVLPAGTTLVSASSTQGTCTGTSTVICTIGTLPATLTATITLNVTLPTTPGPVSNTATVTSTDADSAPTNNTSTVAVTVVGPTAAIPTLSPLMLLMLVASLGAIVVMRTR